MSDALYRHYNDELQFIRQMARDFAKRYPKPASRLQLKDNESTDPHVERLIEAFALIAGRIRLKLDDEFPELTDALLGVLYPHYLAPIPSMAIVQFELDVARNQAANGFLIDRHSMLHTPPVHTRWEDELQVKYRTAYPVTLWPVEVSAARLQPPPFGAGLQAPPRTVAALRLTLACRGDMKFADLSLESLRFYLHGGEQPIAVLYELLFNHALQVVIRPLAPKSQTMPLVLNPGECFAPVGFERDEALLPYPSRSFPGYRLLTEFFTFPAKFLFFDLTSWKRIRRADFGDKLEVVIFLDRTETGLEHSVEASTFRLGCTPVVNLFEQTAEGIDLSHDEAGYLVKPDVAHRRGMEIYSIDSVTSVDPGTGETTEYQPFYSFRHGSSREMNKTFWHPTRKPSIQEDDRGTEVYLSLVDLGFDPRKPPTEALVVRTTCTNRDLPVELQAYGEDLRLELEAGAPLQGRPGCLKAPTAPLRPPTRRGAHWRLISHLSLNHLSIADEEEGRLALQEILRLYDFSDPETGQQRSAVTRDLIDGITSVRSRRVVGRVGPPGVAAGFCQGVEVTVDFDERKYVGTGAYLFASVLDRFLGLYASMNSFTQLVAVVQQREGILKKWPPRAGEHPLL
jgi:type VI secretion system protein ImpG